MTPRMRFGVFDFDPASSELRRDGVPVRLQAQPLQVLSVLVEHAGQVVTREQLRQAVWGTDTFVDFDRGLNYCIAQIRSALGDSAESPRFIRTLPKRGYQFVAPIGPTEAATLVAPAAAPIPPIVEKRPSRKYVVAAIIAIVVCGSLVALIALRQPSTIIAIARFDNETGGAEMDAFADGLTDMVVSEFTNAEHGRYGIVGNAALLRQPRAHRDLTAIASSLNASYVILGQIQRSDSKIRVLAHLIRLPKQTHIAVVRLDRVISDPLATESEVARLIVADFLPRLGASPQSAKH